MMKTRGERLRLAKSLIEKFGWTKGTLYSPDGSMCAVGAILKAEGLNSQVLPLDIANPLVDAMSRVSVDPYGRNLNASDITGWNDYHHRTKEEVIKAFEMAAEACDVIDAPVVPIRKEELVEV